MKDDKGSLQPAQMLFSFSCEDKRTPERRENAEKEECASLAKRCAEPNKPEGQRLAEQTPHGRVKRLSLETTAFKWN